MIELNEHINTLPQDNAKRIFWNQQVCMYNVNIMIIQLFTYIQISQTNSTEKSSRKKGPQGMRWHPLMIRLCIHLKYHSNAAYEIMRGIIHLPSTRTLRDYTHHIKAKPGKSNELIHMYTYYINLLNTNKGLQHQVLLEAIKVFNLTNDIEDFQRYVILSFDEIKIKENIVYNSHTGKKIT